MSCFDFSVVLIICQEIVYELYVGRANVETIRNIVKKIIIVEHNCFQK